MSEREIIREAIKLLDNAQDLIITSDISDDESLGFINALIDFKAHVITEDTKERTK